MKILFGKSKWEAPDLSLEEFLAKCQADGFQAAEIYLPGQSESPEEFRRLHQRHGLRLIAQIISQGSTVEEHQACLERELPRAVACEPLFINLHTGRDHFFFDDNLRLIEFCQEFSAKHQVPLCHETHRGRFPFCAPVTRKFLQAAPHLRLTADFSHWTCVHESDLSDQPSALAAAIQASHHIHARVGFHEGPQVPDPRSPHYQKWRELFLGFWQRIYRARRSAGAEYLTITPEFGPVPYMWQHPSDGSPLADAWSINVWMREWLAREIEQ